MAAGKVWLWVAAVMVCVSCSATAAVIEWTGGGAAGIWEDADNWDGGVPTDTDDVLFDSNRLLVHLGGGTEILSLTVGENSTGDRWLLLGPHTLTLSAIVNNSMESLLDMAVDLTAKAGGLTVSANAAPIFLAGGGPDYVETITLNDGGLIIEGDSDVFIYGLITGTEGITKNGDGTLVIFVSGFENDFAGDVTLNEGVLVLDGFHPWIGGAPAMGSTGSALGVGDIILNGGTLAFVGGLDENYSILDPTQTIFIDGTVVLDAAHTTTRSFNGMEFDEYVVGLADGDERDMWFTNNLVIGDGGAAAHLIFGNEADGDDLIIEFELANDENPASSTITVIDVGDKHDLTVYAEVEIEHKITGDGGLRMTADSTGFLFLINSENDFTGGFELAGGALVVGDGALGSGDFTITGGDNVGDVTLVGMLQDFGYDGGWKDEDGMMWDGSIGVTEIANDVEMSGKFTAAGVKIVEWDDIFDDDEDIPAAFIASNLELAGAVTLTGDTEIAVVTETFVEGGMPSAAVTALNGMVDNNYFVLEISGDIGDGGNEYTLTKSGAGTLILSGAANSFTGGLNVQQGSVELNGGGAVENTVVVTVAQGASLIFNDDEVIGGLHGAGTVDGNGHTISLGSGTSNFTGTLVNQFGITVSDAGTHLISSNLSMDNLAVDFGELTLTGSNTYDNGITTGSGTLILTGTTTITNGGIVNNAALVGNNTSLGSVAIQMNNASTLKALAGGLTAENVSVAADADFTLDSSLGALTLSTPTFGGDATLNQAGGFNASIFNIDNDNTFTLTLASGTLYLIGDEGIASDGGGNGISVSAGAMLIVDGLTQNMEDITGAGDIVKTPNAYATTDEYLSDLDDGGNEENLNLKADAVLATSQGGQLAIDNKNVNVVAGNTARVVGESTIVVNTALNAGNGATLQLDEQATMQVGGALNVAANETLNVTGGGTLTVNSSNATLEETAKVDVTGSKLALGSANATGNAQVALNNATVEATAAQVEIKKAAVQGDVQFTGNKVVVETLETSGAGAAVKTGAAGIEVAALSGASNVAVAEGKVTLTGNSSGFAQAVAVASDAELEIQQGAQLGTSGLTLAGKGTINGTVNGAVTVNDENALLTGIGTFAAGLNVAAGTLNPGQSPGEIVITAGDFVLGANATLNIEVDAAGNHDSIRITGDGDANFITGARVVAVAIGNARDGSYNIITLDGAGNIRVDGAIQAADADLSAFAHDTEMATITALVVDATGKIVVMDVEFNASNVELLAGVGNRSVMSLARMLDSDTIDVTDALAAILGQAQAAGEAPQVAAAYAQLTNQLQASASAAASSVVSSINTNLGRRMEGARTAARNGAGPADGVLVASLAPTAYTSAGNDGWVGFFEGYGSWGDRKNDGGVIGYDYDTYGALLGAEKFVRDDVLVGGSIGYGRTNVKSNDSLSKLDADSLSTSFYGTWFNEDTYVSLTLGYGYHSYDSSRRIAFAGLRAKGDFDAHTFTIAPEIGKLFQYNDVDIEPFAGLCYTHYRQQSYREKGAGDANLSVGSDTNDSIAGELGVRFRKTWLLKNGGRLTPQLKLAWRHDFGDEVVNTARLAGANASFKTTGIDVVSDIFNLGLGVDWKIDNAKTFYTQYDAEFGTRFKAHTLQAGVKILF